MEGIFLPKRFSPWNFLLLFSGLVFIGMFIYDSSVHPEASNGRFLFPIVGIFLCLTVLASWLLNRGAFLRIDGDSLKAKYHWFGRIDCKLSDVDFAFAQYGTLTVRLKDGKVHTVMGLQNAWELCLMLRRNLTLDAKADPKALRQKLDGFRTGYRKKLTVLVSCIAFMFLIIFVTVFLTDGREMTDFTQTDWIIFCGMCGFELAAVVVMFLFADKLGRSNVPKEKLEYCLRRSVVEATPLLPGNAVKVFTDENFTCRITVFGFPKDGAVYLTDEEMTSNYTLVKRSDSELFPSMDELPDGLEGLVEITETVLR